MSFRVSAGCIKTQQPHKQAATCMTYLFDMQVAYQQHAPFLSINISTKPIMAINKIARNSSKFRVIFTVPDFCWAPSCSACRTSMPTVRQGCITTSSGIISRNMEDLSTKIRLDWLVVVTSIGLYKTVKCGLTH